MLLAVQALGLTSRGSGADNIRNITGSATAGIDRQELYDTRPLCSAMHHYILNHARCTACRASFNIAFDGGGRVPVLEDTNDIGFVACEVHRRKPRARPLFPPAAGRHHRPSRFAFETGVLLKPDECVKVAGAVVRAFAAHGDRTNRQKARLKYVLDRMGREAFVAEVEKEYGQPLRRAAGAEIAPRPMATRGATSACTARSRPGSTISGWCCRSAASPPSRCAGLAEISERFGSATLRLTVCRTC